MLSPGLLAGLSGAIERVSSCAFRIETVKWPSWITIERSASVRLGLSERLALKGAEALVKSLFLPSGRRAAKENNARLKRGASGDTEIDVNIPKDFSAG
jgi:hypothetical protein